jgi:uncharacterized protein (TIGR00725 family)
MTALPAIGIIGSGRAISPEQSALAREIGAHIAQRKMLLVCGGLGGIMEAAARGAHENGGLVVGILPTAVKEEANPYIDIVIPSGLGEARNVLVVRTADVLIAFPGAFGTLSEIAIALDLGKSVVCLPGVWELKKAGKMEGARVIEAYDARQAVGMALGELSKKGS